MIPLFKVYTHHTLPEALRPTFESGYIGQGLKVDLFERLLNEKFSNTNRVDSPKFLTTNSATSAEYLALHLLDLQPNDEVLTTPLTCTATNWTLLAHKLHIKWIDIDETNLNIDLVDLTKKLTSKTKLIVLVHWGGYPVDLGMLDLILAKHKQVYGYRPYVIEDCAHALGSMHEDESIVSIQNGNIRFFSFQAVKHLTCGDGGALVLPNQQMHERAKLLRWYGVDRNDNKKDLRCEADIGEWGYKFHMNDIAATIGIENLITFDERLNRGIENANYYHKQLWDTDGVQLVQHPHTLFGQSACWLYSILVQKPLEFYIRMEECGIATSKVHARNDLHSCVKQFKSPLPTLTRIADKITCIPVGWWVTDEDREYIVDCIKKGW